MTEEEIIDILKQKSRDNSRTPVQWNANENMQDLQPELLGFKRQRIIQEINAENALTGYRFDFLSLSKTNTITKKV